MKILLTGAGGFLGQRLVYSLAMAGATVLRLHYRRLPSAAQMDALRAELAGCEVEFRAANLTGRADLPALVEGVDCIVHAAAGMRGAAADMFANTVVATRNLLDAAVAAKVRRFVLVSSFAVYRTAELADGASVDEHTPLEDIGLGKGAYGFAKTRQEQLFQRYRREHGFEGIVLRPGVIYGPGGGALSPRVGLRAMGVFFALGGSVTLPLTHVENCADAIALAALKAADGSSFSVVDDDLPSCAGYFREYRQHVQRMHWLPVPKFAFRLGARLLERYHHYSKGQLPAVFTPYLVRSMYRDFRYSNAALKALGWRPRVATVDGIDGFFAHLAREAGRT